MKDRQVPVHAVDQARVDRRGDVRGVQRPLERGWVLPRLRQKRHLLHFAVHRRAEGPAEAAERVEERRHDLFPIGTVRQRAQVVVSRLIDLHGLPVAQRDGRVGQIGVGDDPVRVRRASRERSGISEQLLLGLGQGMRRPALDVLQVELVDLQPRLGGQELLDRSLRETQDLGLDVQTRPHWRSRTAGSSPASCLRDASRACPGPPACAHRRTSATAPCSAPTSSSARRPSVAGEPASLPLNAPSCGISAATLSFAARHAASLG